MNEKQALDRLEEMFDAMLHDRGPVGRRGAIKDGLFTVFLQGCEILHPVYGDEIEFELRRRWVKKDIRRNDWKSISELCDAWNEWHYAREQLVRHWGVSQKVSYETDSLAIVTEYYNQIAAEASVDELFKLSGHFVRHLYRDRAQSYQEHMKLMAHAGVDGALDLADELGVGAYGFATPQGTLAIVPSGDIRDAWELRFERKVA